MHSGHTAIDVKYVSQSTLLLAIPETFPHYVMNRDTATGHVTGPFVYKSFSFLFVFLSLNINRDTPQKVIPEQLDTGD